MMAGWSLGRNLLVGGVAVALLIAAVASFEWLSGGNPLTGSCIGFVLGTFDVSAATSRTSGASGLAINMSISSTEVGCGETVYANASLINTLESNLTLHADPSAYASLSNWGWRTSQPCGSASVIQMAIFMGYYDGNNFSRAGEALQLGDSSIAMTCTTNSGLPGGYVFLPHSGSAYGLYSTNPSMNGSLAQTSIELRHWACSTKGSETVCMKETGARGYYLYSSGVASFRSFSPGIYTVVGMDVWGDTVFLHFIAR
jgi:hypothetical protein